MSAGFPYLQKLRKSDLTGLAETANLRDFSDLKKSELEIALDEHLRANQSSLSKEESLSDYYKRLGVRMRSPAKRESGGITSGDEKKPRARRQTKAKEEIEATDDEEQSMSNRITSLMKTPARSSLALTQSVRNLPPSPAVVTDVIDRQSARLRSSVSDLYHQSRITEATDYIRDNLSSALAIDVVVLTTEAYGLQREILPWKSVATLPAVRSISNDRLPLLIPDLFVLLQNSFWAPFSLWMLTSVLVPLAAAYFFNLSHKAAAAHRHPTRNSHTKATNLHFDPLVFNVAKALVVYLVYAQHFTFAGLFQHFTIETVSENVPGGYSGMLTAAAIGGLFSLYEAVLKK